MTFHSRIERAARANPILGLPVMAEILVLPPDLKRLLRRLLLELREHMLAKAAESYRKNKWMMFGYWKVAAVYTGHIAKAFRP